MKGRIVWTDCCINVKAETTYVPRCLKQKDLFCGVAKKNIIDVRETNVWHMQKNVKTFI